MELQNTNIRALELTDETPVLDEYAFGMGRKVMPWADYLDITPKNRAGLAARLAALGRAEHTGDVLTIAAIIPPDFWRPVKVG